MVMYAFIPNLTGDGGRSLSEFQASVVYTVAGQAGLHSGVL